MTRAPSLSAGRQFTKAASQQPAWGQPPPFSSRESLAHFISSFQCYEDRRPWPPTLSALRPTHASHCISLQENSTLIYGEGNGTETASQGIEAIRQKLTTRSSRGWEINLESGTVDAQSSKDGGVLLMVTGSLSRSDQKPKQVCGPAAAPPLP